MGLRIVESTNLCIVTTLLFLISNIRLIPAFTPFTKNNKNRHYVSTSSYQYLYDHYRPTTYLKQTQDIVGQDATTNDVKSIGRVETISEQLAKSLDLIPLIEGVASYTGTKRGRDSLLSLVDNTEKESTKRSKSSFKNVTSKRNVAVSSISSKSNGGKDFRNYRQIVRLSQSAAECRHEWKLVQEAMDVLVENKNGCIDLPPIYPEDSSLWDNKDQVDTDDDEWLIEMLNGWKGSLELENILQAEQLVNRIIKTYDWCTEMKEKSIATTIATLVVDFNIAKLVELYDEIKGSVVIAKGKRSYVDPSGTKSFSFELDESRFPILSLLRKKETDLMDKIDAIMQQLMSSRKYMTQITDVGESSGPYELNGRIVIAVRSKDIGSKIGVLRGNANQGSPVYVEPKEITKLGDELVSIRDEITIVKNQITNHFTRMIGQTSTVINRGLDIVASIDVIFARAAFGSILNGCIPQVGNDEGIIRVENFIHPVMAINRVNTRTVPIDLLISNKPQERSLIISGPNAGGKTLAMKSFGLVAMMNRLAIPIPIQHQLRRSISGNSGMKTRIDFFQNIYVKIGDNQNVLQGESTYMAQLNALSRIISQVCSTADRESAAPGYSLILLDELGDGTDPEAGGCIAQAILETILETNSAITISTTHSSRLKALSLSDERFTAASVLLQGGNSIESRFPTYKLSYGTVGQSHALSAAARITPNFPKDLLDRAVSLVSTIENIQGEEIRIITDGLERERELAFCATEKAREYETDSKRCRDALILLTRAYDQHLLRLEDRLESILNTLRNDPTKDSYDIIGESLSELRLVKKKIQTIEEKLKERGLRIVSENDKFKGGENVVIIQEEYTYFDGEYAVVCHDQGGASFDEVIVEIEKTFDWIEPNQDNYTSDHKREKTKLTMKRRDLAVWDYPDEFYSLGDSSVNDFSIVKSIPDSRSRLLQTLNSLKNDSHRMLPQKIDNLKKETKFISSRERKATSKSSKKKKK